MAGSVLDNLTRQAQAVVARNAALLNVSGRGMTVEERARRFYDIPAKVAVARRIEDEERRRAGRHRNDIIDAQRHARWSKGTAEAAGPIFAEMAGIGHEAENIVESLRNHGVSGPYERKGGPPPLGQALDEVRMDLRNNAEGRRAARERREIDPSRLQDAPMTPRQAPLYRRPLNGLSGMPPR